MNSKDSFRISYTARFKLTVVTCALEKGNREAAGQFQIDEKNVRRWRSQQEKLKGLRRDQRAARYCSAKFPELEKELKEWIDEKRKAGIGISTTVIRLKAKSMAKARNVAESEFKALVHWCHRFMDRHDLSIRRRTTISQKLPENFEDKLLKFQRFIIAERKKHEYDLSLLGNANQTPLTFEINKVRTRELYHINEAFKILRQIGAISCDFEFVEKILHPHHVFSKEARHCLRNAIIEIFYCNVLLRTIRFSYWSYGGKAFSGRYPSRTWEPWR